MKLRTAFPSDIGKHTTDMDESRASISSRELTYRRYAKISVAIVFVAIIAYNGLPFFFGGVTEVIMETDDASRTTSCLADSREYQQFVVDLLMPYSRNNSNRRDHKQWMSQMLDATGKWQSGVLGGNTYWMGSFLECVRIRDRPSEIAGQYCTMSATYQLYNDSLTDRIYGESTGKYSIIAKTLNIQFGVCWPASCSENDTEKQVSSLLDAFKVTDVQVSINPDSCYTDKPVPYDLVTKTIIFVFLCFVLLIIGATTYDLCYDDRVTEETVPKEMKTTLSFHGTIMEMVEETNFTDMTNENKCRETPVVSDIDSKVENGPQPTSQSVLHEILMSFSARRNAHNLLSTKTDEGYLEFFNGIRCLSMSGIVLAHVYSVLISTDWFLIFKQNDAEVRDIVSHPLAAPILNSSLSVDNFLFIGGFLVAFTFLRHMEKSGGKFGVSDYLSLLERRCWRLMPIQLVFMAIYAGLYSHMGTGPYWRVHESYMVGNCRTSWWKNMLFIQNMDNIDKMCIDSSWYIVAPFILYALYKKPWLGFLIVGVLCASSVIFIGVTTYIYNLHSFYEANILGDRTWLISYANRIVIQPVSLMATYLMGISLAYILHWKKMKFNLHPVFVATGWILALILSYLLLFGTHAYILGDQLPTLLERSVFAGIRGPVWTLVTSWVVFMCATGYGGVVNTVLSWRVLMPLSRMTYGVYMAHDLILAAYGASQKTIFYIDGYILIFTFFGLLMLSLVLSFVVTLAFEAPVMELQKRFRK